MLVDSHAHLNFPDFDGRVPEMIAQAREAGVEKIINIGTSFKDSREAIELAGKYEGLYATVGIHPNDNLDTNEDNVDWGKLEELARMPKVVAVGECGLDCSRIEDLNTFGRNKERIRQENLFWRHLMLALKVKLPVSIHLRDAQKDLIEIYGKTLKDLTGVFHCFSGDVDYLEFILNELPRFYISFAGNVTFRNAGQLQELAKLVPLDRLLVETDCPFLAPEPLRGSQNVPANVKITASKLAEIKGVLFFELSQKTTENCQKLFKI